MISSAMPFFMPATTTPQVRTLLIAVALIAVALVVSFIDPHDRLTWLMEVMPVLIAVPVPVLALTDAPTSPLAALASVALYAHSQRQWMPSSDTAALGLIEALSAAVAVQAQHAVAAAAAATQSVMPWLSHPNPHENPHKPAHENPQHHVEEKGPA